MTDELHRAATTLRLFGQVERAHALGDMREVERLISGVDPIELADLASMVQIIALSLPRSSNPQAGAVPSSSDGTPRHPAPASPLRAVPCS